MKHIVILLFLIVNLSLAQQTKQTVTDSILTKLVDEHHTYNTSTILDILGTKRYPEKSNKIIAFLLQNATTNREKADCHYSLANYYYFNNKLDSAKIAINKAENSVNKKESPLLAASILTTKAGILKKTGVVVQANRLQLEALQLLEKLDTTKLSKKALFKSKGKKMVIYNSIALFNMKLNNYELANNYLSKAIAMAKAMGEKATAGILLNNQGDLLIKMEKYKAAVKVLEESEALKKESKLPQSFQLSTALNLTNARYNLNKTDKALSDFNSLIKNIKEIKNKSLLSEALLGRGIIYKDQKEHKRAIADLKQAYDLAVQIKDVALQKRISKNLYQTYYSFKNYKKAVDYQNTYTVLKDSIFNDNNIKKLTQMEMQYHFDKKTALQKIKTKSALERNKQIIKMLILGLIGLFIILGLGYRLYYLKKKNSSILEQKNKIINKQLKDNETLLKETHHRVKNSLQMISSLLYLQSENIEDEKAAASVKDGQIRVKSMALIHQKLYQNDNLTGVEVTDYIEDLAESIFQSHNINNDKIALNIDVEKMILDIDTITPIGIIINELIVNSLKHAFPENEQGLITISLHKKDNQLILKIADNGQGFKKKKKKEKSFGMKLIKSLSRKLKADLIFNQDNGTEVILIINRFKIK